MQHSCGLRRMLTLHGQMIDMIRIGQTRNLLRASSSLLEMWPRSAHHHPGQRHLSGRANRPDKSTHSITCPDDQKFLANRAASTKEGWMSGPSPPPFPPGNLILPPLIRAAMPCAAWQAHSLPRRSPRSRHRPAARHRSGGGRPRVCARSTHAPPAPGPRRR
jgi:hypothetical protein